MSVDGQSEGEQVIVMQLNTSLAIEHISLHELKVEVFGLAYGTISRHFG